MLKIFRASLFHFLKNPEQTKEIDESYSFIEDGLLVIKNGKVVEVGAYEKLKEKYDSTEIIDYSGKWILPGFVDTHIHYPQTEMIASHGAELLNWLETYTFP